MNPVLILTRLTFQEAIRRKIVLAILILGAAFLILYGVGIYFLNQEFISPSNPEAHIPAVRYKLQALNFYFLAGMYAVNFLGIATAALISADSLAGEIQSGTIQALASKPIQRRTVIMGKWAGHFLLLFLYILLMGGGVVLIVHVLADYAAPNWPVGLALIFFNSLFIMTLTMTFSSSFSTLATGGAVFGAYGVAFLGGWVERIGSLLNSQSAVNLGILSSLLLPTEAVWNKAAAQMASPLFSAFAISPFTSASEPSALMLGYTGIYLAVIFLVCVRQFNRRDL